jgi:hypothetical protein
MTYRTAHNITRKFVKAYRTGLIIRAGKGKGKLYRSLLLYRCYDLNPLTLDAKLPAVRPLLLDFL